MGSYGRILKRGSKGAREGPRRERQGHFFQTLVPYYMVCVPGTLELIMLSSTVTSWGAGSASVNCQLPGHLCLVREKALWELPVGQNKAWLTLVPLPTSHSLLLLDYKYAPWVCLILFQNVTNTQNWSINGLLPSLRSVRSWGRLLF